MINIYNKLIFLYFQIIYTIYHYLFHNHFSEHVQSNIMGTIFEPNNNNPIITLVNAEIRQAAAAISFACFAKGWNSGLAKSTVRSIAVLSNSVIITMEIVITRIIHSKAVKCKIKPKIVAKIPKHVCTFKFLSRIKAENKPSNAYRKDKKNLFIINPYPYLVKPNS